MTGAQKFFCSEGVEGTKRMGKKVKKKNNGHGLISGVFGEKKVNTATEGKKKKKTQVRGNRLG